jgi:hypothetical protein
MKIFNKNFTKESGNRMNKKNISGIIGGAMLLLGAFCIGMGSCPTPGSTIQGELREACMKLGEHYTGTQSEMTMVSAFQLQLALMELEHVRYTILSQENHVEIESAFMQAEQAWEEFFQQEQEKSFDPLEHGSIAVFDHNLQMVDLVVQHIATLQESWYIK